MDFGSHISSTVLYCVDVVNALTPGESAGRPYPAPAVDEARALVEKSAGSDLAAGRYTLSDAEVTEFAQVAGRLRPVFEAVAAGDLDTAAETVNALMSDWHAQPMLSRHDGEPWHLHFHRPEVGYVEGTSAGMATSLAYVIGSEYADRLGVCSAPACDRVYADTSRNGTRRFCSTACQNRVKAAAFRARKAGAV